MAAAARTPPLVSTTRQTLVRLRGWLLGITAVTLASSLAIFLGVAGNADVAADRSVPAILASYDAQDALRNAHLAAVRNLAEGGEVLGGPGVDYQRQIAGAGQYLTLLAENNAAGDEGTQAIQTIEALLVTYTGLIGQADARYRDAGLRALGVAALRDAASMLDDILVRLEFLRGMQLRAMDDQVNNVWTNKLTAAVWLLPLVGLGMLLIRTQMYLTRRFRRTMNVPLLVATVATVGMVALTALSLWSADKLDQARAGVEAVHDSRQGQLEDVRFRAANGLASAVQEQCKSACADTIADIAAPAPAPSSTPGRAIVAADATITADAVSAADSHSVELALPLLALGIAVLVLAGFRPRLAEYGERST